MEDSKIGEGPTNTIYCIICIYEFTFLFILFLFLVACDVLIVSILFNFSEFVGVARRADQL